MNIFGQGAFQINPNMTPQQLAAKRAAMQRIVSGYGGERYVVPGIVDLIGGIIAGQKGKALDAFEADKTAQASSLFNSLLGGSPLGGPGSYATSPGSAMAPVMPQPVPTADYTTGRVASDQQLGFGLQPMQTGFDMGAPVTPAMPGDGGIVKGPIDPAAGQLSAGVLSAIDQAQAAPVAQQPGPQLGFGLGIGGGNSGTPSASDSGIRTTVSTMGPRADAIIAGLMQRGLPEHVAMGIVANLADESGLNPSAVGDNGNAFGLAQWNGPRKQALMSYAANRGANPADPQVQMDFLVAEMQGPESAAGQAVMSAPDAASAATAFLHQYERPAAQYAAAREAKYTGGALPSGGALVGSDGGPDVSALMQAMANPWLPPDQKAMIQGLLSQQMQRMDPMYQMQMQKAQLDLQNAQNPAASGGEYGLQPIVTQDADGKYHLFQIAKDGSQPKEIPLPYGWTPQQQYLDTGTGYVPVPKQGVGTGPEIGKDVAGAAAAGAQGKAQGEAANALDGARVTVQSTIDLVDQLIADPNLPSVIGPIQGRGPTLTAGQAEAQARIDQLKGKAFLEAYNTLKGGGAIANAEGEKAQAAIVRMSQPQNEHDFIQALIDFKTAMKNGLDSLQAKAGPVAPPTASGGAGGEKTFDPATGAFK